MPLHATPANRMLSLDKERAEKLKRVEESRQDSEQTSRDERRILNEFWPTPAWSVLEVTIYRRQQVMMNILMNPASTHEAMIDARAGVRELGWLLGLRGAESMRRDVTE